MNEIEISTELQLLMELNNFNVPSNKFGIDSRSLCDCISKDLSLTREFKISSAALSKLLSITFPNRPKTRNNIKQWILSLAYLKYCPKCKDIKPFEEFDKNTGKGPTNLNAYCKQCNLIAHGKDYYKNYSAKRKADKLLRTPLWADIYKIKEIYRSCPIAYEVDHIIPLRGELVSGLHVHNNLQYLTKSENSRKNNSWVVS